MERRLKLNEFRVIYQALKKGIPWLDHLILGLLVWLEERYIDQKVKKAVDQAVEEVVLPPLSDYVTPVYSEKPSEASRSLPEMRLTAPWYKEKGE